MMKFTRRLANVCLAAWLLTTGGCKPGGVTTEEVERLVDARLAARGLAARPSASSSASGLASHGTSAKGDAEDPAVASLAFLARLDGLMKDYTPQLPGVEDKSDVLRCVTSEAARSSSELQSVASKLKKMTDAAKQDRKQAVNEFYNTLYPLAFHYDLDWQTRKASAVAPTYACWCGSSWIRMQNCGGCERRERTHGHPEWFAYSRSESSPTQPPELMRRMEAATIIPPPRFSCRVDDVVFEGGHKMVKCDSSGVTAALRISGEMKPVNAGDVVSVPLATAKRDPDGVLFKNVGGKNEGWVVDADGASLTVDAAATCPSMAEILAAVGSPSTK